MAAHASKSIITHVSPTLGCVACIASTKFQPNTLNYRASSLGWTTHHILAGAWLHQKSRNVENTVEKQQESQKIGAYACVGHPLRDFHFQGWSHQDWTYDSSCRLPLSPVADCQHTGSEGFRAGEDWDPCMRPPAMGISGSGTQLSSAMTLSTSR